MNQSQMEFPISIYGNVEQINDTLSKARCRIFYKGGNRNGTFITDAFANELISTLHYVPVKGIHNGDDFTDHGENRSDGQIYGIVPVENNFAWEQHLDDDGVERTYACTDVLLFSALYPEAATIIGKGQSMELYGPSLTYHTAILQGQKYIVFEHGSFLGLQVLGDDVEPCFEGASFFSLQQSIQDTIHKIKEFSKLGGQSEMPKINFKLSDSQKADFLWLLLNPEYCEEGNWTVSHSINAIYDDYALAYNYETGDYERVYYTKNDETDSIEITEIVKVFVMDITESEKNTVETLRQLNGGTYELVSEVVANAEENAQKCEEFSIKIDELNENIATLNTEVENVRSEYANIQEQLTESEARCAEANENYSKLSEETELLKNFKVAIETQHKEAVVSEYSGKLSEEVLDTYKAKLDEYTAEDLDMHLAYELKKSGSSMFGQTPEPQYIPKEVKPSGVEAILARYKK